MTKDSPNENVSVSNTSMKTLTCQFRIYDPRLTADSDLSYTERVNIAVFHPSKLCGAHGSYRIEHSDAECDPDDADFDYIVCSEHAKEWFEEADPCFAIIRLDPLSSPQTSNPD